MSKSNQQKSDFKILRPCDVNVDHIVFKKRISNGNGIYEYPITYMNNPLIIQTPIVYIPYSTYKIENKITFDFNLNTNDDIEMDELQDLICNLDVTALSKINTNDNIKACKRREFISNVKKHKSGCMNETTNRMRVSLYNNIKVYNSKSHLISIDTLKGKSSLKLLLSPTKIWVNRNKCGIFWEVLQVKLYPKTELNTYMFLEEKNPNCTCVCSCNKPNKPNKQNNPYQNDTRFTVYFDMLKKGVPKQAVVNKMLMENKDPSVLDSLKQTTDEYIMVDGLSSIKEVSVSPRMNIIFSDLQGGAKKLKKVKDSDKKRRRIKTESRSSYSPCLDEIVNMRSSLKQTNSQSRMAYLTSN
jgi:hypothetical protein